MLSEILTKLHNPDSNNQPQISRVLNKPMLRPQTIIRYTSGMFIVFAIESSKEFLAIMENSTCGFEEARDRHAVILIVCVSLTCLSYVRSQPYTTLCTVYTVSLSMSSAAAFARQMVGLISKFVFITFVLPMKMMLVPAKR